MSDVYEQAERSDRVYAPGHEPEDRPADRERQLVEAQKRLAYAAERLGNTVDELASRLYPVLRPEPEDGAAEKGADVHLVRAPLAQFVVDHAEMVMRSDRQLQQLLDRLEL